MGMVIWQLMAIKRHSRSWASAVRHLNLILPRTTASIPKKAPCFFSVLLITFYLASLCFVFTDQNSCGFGGFVILLTIKLVDTILMYCN